MTGYDLRSRKRTLAVISGPVSVSVAKRLRYRLRWTNRKYDPVVVRRKPSELMMMDISYYIQETETETKERHRNRNRNTTHRLDTKKMFVISSRSGGPRDRGTVYVDDGW